MTADPLLEVKDLSVRFETDEGPLQAVDRVSFAVRPGEVLGLVGDGAPVSSIMPFCIMFLTASRWYLRFTTVPGRFTATTRPG